MNTPVKSSNKGKGSSGSISNRGSGSGTLLGLGRGSGTGSGSGTGTGTPSETPRESIRKSDGSGNGNGNGVGFDCTTDVHNLRPSDTDSASISVSTKSTVTHTSHTVQDNISKSDGIGVCTSGNGNGDISMILYLTIATVINCCAILLLNLFYVYVSLRANTYWTWATIMWVAMCKTVWNVKIIPLMLIQASLANGDISIKSGKMAVLQSIWIMFNNVVAPLVATLSMDSSCYLSLFIAPDPITTNYAFPVCQAFNTTSGTCLDEIVIGGTDMNFHPPFIYSCQCSSSLLVKYVPLYIIVYGFTGIVLPTFQIIMLDVLERITVYREKIEALLQQESLEHSISSVSSRGRFGSGNGGGGGIGSSDSTNFNARMVMYWDIKLVARVTLGLIPPLMWPIRAVIAQRYVDKTKTVQVDPSKSQSKSKSQVKETLQNAVQEEQEEVEEKGQIQVHGDSDIQRRQQTDTPNPNPNPTRSHSIGRVSQGVSTISMSAMKFYARNKNLYKFQSITCNVIASLAVLLTFGIAYPPLAVLISLYICSTTSVLHLTVTKHLQQCPSSYLDNLISRIKRESNGLLHVLYKSTWVLIIFMCGFVSCFTIDQTQDVYLALINITLGGIILLVLFFSRSAIGLEWYNSYYRNSHTSTSSNNSNSTNSNRKVQHLDIHVTDKSQLESLLGKPTNSNTNDTNNNTNTDHDDDDESCAQSQSTHTSHTHYYEDYDYDGDEA